MVTPAEGRQAQPDLQNTGLGLAIPIRGEIQTKRWRPEGLVAWLTVTPSEAAVNECFV